MNKDEMKSLMREVLVEMIEDGEVYIDRDIYLTHEGHDDFGNSQGAITDVELYLRLEIKGKE